MSAEESANFSRVSSLVITIGTDLLRKIFQKRNPEKTKGVKLNVEFSKLDSSTRHLLSDDQAVVLCNNEMNKFDIFLLVYIFRNICKIDQPAKGWDTMPDDTDVSLAAELFRLQKLRNHISHLPVALVATEDFKDIWNAVEAVLIRLADPAGVEKQDLTKQITIEKRRSLAQTAPSTQRDWDPFIKWYRSPRHSTCSKRTKELFESCGSPPQSTAILQDQVSGIARSDDEVKSPRKKQKQDPSCRS